MVKYRDILFDSIAEGLISESALLNELLASLSENECESIADTLGLTELFYEDLN
jgi:hypothetical protein